MLASAFNGLFCWAVYQTHSAALANEKGMEFLTGYLIEKSLAVDNIFVFLMIFHLLRGAAGLPEAGADDRHHRPPAARESETRRQVGAGGRERVAG